VEVKKIGLQERAMLRASTRAFFLPVVGGRAEISSLKIFSALGS